MSRGIEVFFIQNVCPLVGGVMVLAIIILGIINIARGPRSKRLKNEGPPPEEAPQGQGRFGRFGRFGWFGRGQSSFRVEDRESEVTTPWEQFKCSKKLRRERYLKVSLIAMVITIALWILIDEIALFVIAMGGCIYITLWCEIYMGKKDIKPPFVAGLAVATIVGALLYYIGAFNLSWELGVAAFLLWLGGLIAYASMEPISFAYWRYTGNLVDQSWPGIRQNIPQNVWGPIFPHTPPPDAIDDFEDRETIEEFIRRVIEDAGLVKQAPRPIAGNLGTNEKTSLPPNLHESGPIPAQSELQQRVFNPFTFRGPLSTPNGQTFSFEYAVLFAMRAPQLGTSFNNVWDGLLKGLGRADIATREKRYALWQMLVDFFSADKIKVCTPRIDNQKIYLLINDTNEILAILINFYRPTLLEAGYTIPPAWGEHIEQNETNKTVVGEGGAT